MKRHYFPLLALLACGETTTSSNQGGCTSNDECTGNQICIEKECREQPPSLDSTIDATLELDARHIPKNQGILNGIMVSDTIEKSILVTYNINNGRLKRLTDTEGSIITLPPNYQLIAGVPSLSPDGMNLLYTAKNQNDELEMILQSVNTGEYKILGPNNTIPSYAWINNTEFVFDREEQDNTNMYQQSMHGNVTLIATIDKTNYLTGIAAQNELVVYTCPGDNNTTQLCYITSNHGFQTRAWGTIPTQTEFTFPYPTITVGSEQRIRAYLPCIDKNRTEGICEVDFLGEHKITMVTVHPKVWEISFNPNNQKLALSTMDSIPIYNLNTNEQEDVASYPIAFEGKKINPIITWFAWRNEEPIR